VDAYHNLIARKFEEEVNNNIKKSFGKATYKEESHNNWY
jgi:hypothetical protein